MCLDLSIRLRKTSQGLCQGSSVRYEYAERYFFQVSRAYRARYKVVWGFGGLVFCFIVVLSSPGIDIFTFSKETRTLLYYL